MAKIVRIGNARSVEMAFAYLSRGIALTLVRENEKRPIGKNWQKDAIRNPEDASQFREHNVGILMGQPSQWLTDIDLDCEEAVALAPYLLPATPWVFGRPSNPNSHYLYTVKGSSTKKFASDTMLLEIRSTGAQTIAPGSVHPSGETIQWVGGDWRRSDPPEIKLDTFERACRDLAAATLVLRHGWKEGKRDDVAVAVCGLMLRSGRSEGEINHWLESIAKVAGDEELDMRLKAEYQRERLDANQKVPGIPSLINVLGNDLSRQLIDWLGIKDLGVVEKLNRELAIIRVGKQSRYVPIPGSELWDGNYIFMKRSDTEDWYCKYGDVKVGTKGRTMLAFDYWRQSPLRNEYSRVDFHPDGACPAGVLNLWQGWPITPDPDHSKCALFLKHVKQHVCAGRESLYKYVMTWLADAVQNPTRRPGVALILQGDEGNGKTLFGEYVLRMYAHYGLIATNQDHLFGKHNSFLQNKLMVFADESAWAGNHHHEAVLKNLITGEKLSFEPKGIDSYEVRSYMRLMMATNSDWAVPAGRTARRFCIIEMSNRAIGDYAFFDAYAHEMENGGPGALLHLLMTWPVEIELKKTPKTMALAKAKFITQMRENSVLRWWVERLKNTETIQGSRVWEQVIEVERLQNDYLRFLERRRNQRDLSEAISFGMKFKDIVPGLEIMRKRVGGQGYTGRGQGSVGAGRVTRFYKLPTLQSCLDYLNRIVFENDEGDIIDLL